MDNKITEIIYLPTVRCNMNCKHCGEEQNIGIESEISCNKIYEALSECHFIDKRLVAISGGEPFLKEGLEDFIVQIIDDGWDVAVTSNGYFTDKMSWLMERLGDNCNHISFAISLDGLKDTHCNIRRNSQAFDHAIETISMLSQYACTLQINTVVQVDNLSELHAIEKLVVEKSHGKAKVAFIPKFIMISENHEGEYDKAYVESIWPYIDYIKFKLYVSKLGHINIEPGKCKAGTNNILIGSDGGVYTCCGGAYYTNSGSDFCIGNLRYDSLDNIWNSNVRNQVIAKVVNSCAGCDSACDLDRELSVRDLFKGLSNEETERFLARERNELFFCEGWHDEELSPDGKRFRWMSETSAFMLARTIGGVRTLAFTCFNNSGKDIDFRIVVNGTEATHHRCSAEPQNVFIEVPSGNYLTDVEFEIDECWKPCEIYGSEDIRSLGIGIMY